MKKTRELLWMLLAVVLFPIALGGCGGGGDSAAKVSRVTTDRPAVLLGEMPDLDFMPALVSRLTNKTEGEIADDTEVVVLHDRFINSLTDAQRAGLKKVYERGGIVILIEPTYDEITKVAGIVGHELAAAMDRGAEHFCDLYAFNGDWHTYVVGHTHADPASGDASLDLAAETAYYETMMDSLVEWIDNGGPTEEPSSSQSRGEGDGTPRLQDIAKAQTLVFNDPFVRSDMKPSSGFTNTYRIYALYDFDHDYDYYIFDLEGAVVNGPMYVDKTWTDKRTTFWGYWLYSYETSHQMEGTPVGGSYMAFPADVCDIIDPQPTTQIGSTSYTVSQSKTWSGSLGFSGMGATGGLSYGVSYSASNTTDLSDIEVNYLSGQGIGQSPTRVPNTYWWYRAQNLPGVKSNKKDITAPPPPRTVSTSMFYNKWIWRIKDPRKNGGKFNTLCAYQPTYTCNSYTPRDSVFAIPSVTRENEARYNVYAWRIIALIPPPREKPAATP